MIEVYKFDRFVSSSVTVLLLIMDKLACSDGT